MGFVNSLPGAFETLSIERKTTTYNDYNQATGETWTGVDSVQGKVQIGSMADSVVSDKFKSVVAATAWIDPDDVNETILNTDRVAIGDIIYSIIYIDNIEGVSIEMPLKLWEA